MKLKAEASKATDATARNKSACSASHQARMDTPTQIHGSKCGYYETAQKSFCRFESLRMGQVSEWVSRPIAADVHCRHGSSPFHQLLLFSNVRSKSAIVIARCSSCRTKYCFPIILDMQLRHP
jgi:hypothetical protein